MTEVAFSELKVGDRVVYDVPGEQTQPGVIVDTREDEGGIDENPYVEVEIDFDDGFTGFTLTDDACEYLELEQ